MLYGRQNEQVRLEGVLAAATRGASAALVVRGEPGIGKTALLNHAVSLAAGVRVLRGQGIEAEAELPFAGLHLLLHPVLGKAQTLPGPQRRALLGAFGLTAPEEPVEPLFVGLAVLSLLSELAEQGPLLCVVDDAQWLDRGTAEALMFAARRMRAEGIVMLFAARGSRDVFPGQGLEELHLDALAPQDAARLLDHSGQGLPAALRDRVLAAAHGNPLALLELPTAMARETADGQSLAGAPEGALPLTDRLRHTFGGQVDALPAATRTLLLLAAAEHHGDLHLVVRAAAPLGAGPADFAPAERAELVRVAGQSIVFRHPLVRAAAYRRASYGERLTAHRALADALAGGPQAAETGATGPGARGSDLADRHAWHLAAATHGQDETAAAGLQAAAERARARGGYAAAAAAQAYAARLTPDLGRRTRRLAVAAATAAEAGDFDQARGLAEQALTHADDPSLRARLLQVRAAADFGRGALRDANVHMVEGAALAADHDPRQALTMTLEAVHIAWFIEDGGVRPRTARQVAACPIPSGDPLAPVATLLQRLVSVWEDRSETAPSFAEVVRDAQGALADEPRGLVLVSAAMLAGAQDEELYELASTLVSLGREHGRIGWLPPALSYLTAAQFALGRPRAALDSASEALRLAHDTGQTQWTGQLNAVLAVMAAAAGDGERCRALAAGALDGTPAPNIGGAHWALGLLALGDGRAAEALPHLEALAEGPERYLAHSTRSIPDLVEAAVRAGETHAAKRAFTRLSNWARWAQQPVVDALVMRCQALLSTGEEAEKYYSAALELHERAPRPYEEARTRLVYGEWLRRDRRKAEAGVQLRSAQRAFDRLGAEPWARRARTELGATGTSAPDRRPVGALSSLTPQESQIVRMAARGLSNRDIAARLFLSPRTVGHHLYKAYPKLNVASRAQLPAVVPADDSPPEP
ncbi:ATP-binding protein [Streptomyces sp. NPDC001834]|uniref:ATP-binding protein n=1 Tax=unclassified Streptomyces TaxID=2593676 RepID=UPI003420664F